MQLLPGCHYRDSVQPDLCTVIQQSVQDCADVTTTITQRLNTPIVQYKGLLKRSHPLLGLCFAGAFRSEVGVEFPYRGEKSGDALVRYDSIRSGRGVTHCVG